MNSNQWTGDDNRDSLGPDPDAVELIHHPHQDGECECHCDRCGEPMDLDPIFGRVYSKCGDCYGEGPTFDDALGARGEAQQQMDEARRLKR